MTDLARTVDLTPIAVAGLTAAQRTAAHALAMGHSATATGVDRCTVWRWKTKDPYFIAEVNRLRQELHEAAASRARRLALKALVAAEAGIDAAPADERARLALRPLALLKVGRWSDAPAGGTDWHGAVDDMVRADRASCGYDPNGPIDNKERKRVLEWAAEDEADARRKGATFGGPAVNRTDGASGSD